MPSRLQLSPGIWAIAFGLIARIPSTTFAERDASRGKPETAPATKPIREQVDQLEARVKAQQTRVEHLQARVDEVASRPTTTTRIAEVRKVVDDVLADGDFSEKLYVPLQQVGYDKGFYIKSADETFLLMIRGYMRVRWTGQNRQTDDRAAQGRQKQDDINGVEIEDLRLSFQGHIHSPRLSYRMTVKGGTDGVNNWKTHDAWITYEFAEELRFSTGLVKIPFGRQELVGKSALQFIDRSLANEVFNLGRSIGAGVHGMIAKRLSYGVGIFNGIADRNDLPGEDQYDTNFSYVARLVGHILGSPIRAESDLAHSKDPRLGIGLSFAYNDDNGDRSPSALYSIPDRIRRGRGIGGNANADLTGTDLFQFGTDAAFRYRGFSLTTEYWLRTVDGESKFSAWEQLTGRNDAMHQQGGYVQAGYFIIPSQVELAARLGGVWDNHGDNVWEYAFGVNYFPWASYNLLLQADFTRIAEAPTTSSSANWSQNDDITMVRVQMQVRF